MRLVFIPFAVRSFCLFSCVFVHDLACGFTVSIPERILLMKRLKHTTGMPSRRSLHFVFDVLLSNCYVSFILMLFYLNQRF